MAEFPALPLWTDAYLGDTTHLTTIEHGAYLLLLMVAWRSSDCRLPDDNKLLARYTRLSGQQWKRIRPVIEDFFVVEDGFWRQRRLTDEAVAVKQRRDQAAEAGRASALKRKGRHSTGVQQSVNETSTRAQPKGNITSTNNQEEKTGTKKAMPEGWKPAPFGLDTQCHKIESGWSTDDLLRHLEAFKAHHRREGSKFVDWQAAWSAWVLNSERFGKQRTNGQHRPAEPDSYVDVLEREERNRAILAARNANPEAAAGRG